MFRVPNESSKPCRKSKPVIWLLLTVPDSDSPSTGRRSAGSPCKPRSNVQEHLIASQKKEIRDATRNTRRTGGMVAAATRQTGVVLRLDGGGQAPPRFCRTTRPRGRGGKGGHGHGVRRF